MLTAECSEPPNASPNSRPRSWGIASQELQYSFYLKASDPARRSWAAKFQIRVLYTVLGCILALLCGKHLPFIHETEALQWSSSLCSYSSLSSTPDTAFLWLRKGTSDPSRNKGKAPTRGSPSPTIASPTPQKNHLHCEPPCTPRSPLPQRGPDYPSFSKSLILLWQGAKKIYPWVALIKTHLHRTQRTAKAMSEK